MLALVVLNGLLLLEPGSAAAGDVQLRLTLSGQGYQTRTIAGDLLDRRRLTQWVDLRANRLLGMDKLSFESSFRFSAELGFGDDLDAMGGDQAELMLAQVRWSGLVDRVDVYLGRQLFLDELDFLSFDGLRLDLMFPARFKLRLLAGFAVRDRSFLGGEVLELDGVEDSSVPAPLVGAGILWRYDDIWLGVDYRRMVLWEEGWPLQDERIGASTSARLWKKRIGLDGGAVFDLLEDHWDRLWADGWFRLPGFMNGFRFHGGYLRSRPHFALDSIFNFFSPAPFDEYRAGARWDAGKWMSVHLAYTHRDYRAAESGEPEGDGAGWKVDGLDMDARMKAGSAGLLSLVVGYEEGASGRRWLVTPRFDIALFEKRLVLDWRCILAYFKDPVQANQYALTVGGSAGATWRFDDDKAVLVMAQLNGNRIHPLRLRLLAVLDLAFHFGSGRIYP